VAPRKKAPLSKKGEEPGITLLPIRCMGCGTPGALELPGPAPWPGGMLQKTGWTVLNDPEEGHVVFVCGPCFEEETTSSDSKIKGEGSI
jgi:hypothetical protein